MLFHKMNSKQSITCLYSSSPIHFMFTVLVILLISAPVSSLDGNETDHQALLKIKSMITQDPYAALTSWNSSTHFCDWSHVYCGKRHRRVIYLRLSSQGLEGFLSPYIGNLSFLRGLQLGNNSFQGVIPNEVGNLSRLRSLYLFSNKLSGAIPANLSGCSNLLELSLSRNRLVGSIPKEMSSLSKLTFLSLEYNKLTGEIPPFLGNITSMKVFAISGNPFGGSIPYTLGHWKILEEFYSYDCNLYGSIPQELGGLSRLRILQLRHNNFNGVIPTNISGCSNLEMLGLSENKLVGSIPKEIGSLSKLIYVSFSNNYLTGGITPSLGNISSMESFTAIENPLGGSIPDTLGQWKNLKGIFCSNCGLSGTIPHSLYNLSFLTDINLGGNQLTGSLPPTIVLPHLALLILWRNRLTGPPPLFISNCSKLRHLDIPINNFKGKLTIDFAKLRDIKYISLGENNFGSHDADEMKFVDSLNNSTRLELLDLSKCKFQGVLPRSIGNLSNQLRDLRLHENQLHGNLPGSIGNLVGLEMLSLGGNQFTGNIPSSIGKLRKLQALYLYENQLSGQIPQATGNLSLLITLYLYSNKLDGVIPSSLGNCHRLLELFLDNNNLSGKIPTQVLQLSSLSRTLDLSHNNLFGSLPLEVGNLKMLSALDFSENNLSGFIPSTLSGCASLSSLSLKGNLFQGIIPSSLSSMKGLVKLDLSQNNLSGQIPNFLEKLKLEYLNLSYNDFVGDVPMSGVFANGSAFSVLGNSRLCGGFVELGLPRCKKIEQRTKKFPLYAIVVLIASTFFTMMCLAYVWCKKKSKRQLSQPSMSELFLKVSYSQLLKATNGFSEANLIGKGGSSSVYKGILDGDDDRIVAVKVLHLQNQGAQRSFMRECEVWRNIRHRNMLRIITSCASIDFQGNDFKALVYDYMPNGSLHDWLHPSEGTPRLNILQITNILIDVSSALDYIHNHCLPSIVHGDLKPSNILLNDDMVAHVGDFGLARFLGTTPHQYSSSEIRGTIGYAAPEYGIGSEMTSSGDVYSFGILVLEVMIGKRPTDELFNNGLSLHKFASMALPDHVPDVIDASILHVYQEDEAFMQNHEANAEKIEECLTSILMIGVSCSVDSPHERMDIKEVVPELHHILNTLQNI